jgi:ATP-binding cassette subfamily B protein
MRLVAAAIRLAWTGGWQRLAAMFGIAMLLGAVPVAVTWAMKEIFDSIGQAAITNRLMGFVVLAAALGAVAAALPQAQRYVAAEFGRQMGLKVRENLHSAVNRFVGIGWSEDPRFQDRLRLAAQAGQSGPTQVVSEVIATVQAAIMFTGFVGALILLSPWLLLVVVTGAMPAVWTEVALNRSRALVTIGLTHAARREIFYSQLATGVAAAKEVRLFGLGAFLNHRMLSEARHINRENRTLDRRETLTQGALAALSAGITGFALVWAIRSAVTGTLTIGDVAVFVAAVAGVQTGLAGVLNSFGQVYQSLMLFREYREVVTQRDPAAASSLARVEPLQASIELRDVWFRYDNSHPWILTGLDLTIPAGASTALVGLNGAGKSTVVKLLCRFYDPERGAILWDGVDIRRFDPAALRDRLGAVFQDFVSYDLTARENVGMGDLSHVDDDGRVRQAADRAGCASVVRALPRGLDTMLTRTFMDLTSDDPETGVVLSGGQWQRLALARALMRADRDLLILDEPSSGLDADAEHDIHERLRALRQGRTSLLISHRLSTLRDADVIAVLDSGRVAEIGRHDELLALEGIYARLFDRQARGYQPIAAT